MWGVTQLHKQQHNVLKCEIVNRRQNVSAPNRTGAKPYQRQKVSARTLRLQNVSASKRPSPFKMKQLKVQEKFQQTSCYSG